MACFVTTAKNCCSDYLERGSVFVQGGTHLVLRLRGLSGLESQKEKETREESSIGGQGRARECSNLGGAPFTAWNESGAPPRDGFLQVDQG